MAKLFVDGRPYQIDPRDNLLKACLQLGFDLPYFCWHPALHSVGACRQCAIRQYRDESDTTGSIVMACMTPAADGSRISINEPEARDFRANVVEWLMINHPHDCPVCEEGGECHLQDMTLLTGHTKRRYRGLKRTHRNQDLGPFINHEMNRCIACYRCTRFYRDYAGGADLHALGAHDHVYFGRYQDGPLENEFSGNLVEVCPTGVFTDKTLGAHYTRKWDLQAAPGICHHCSLGCNISPAEREGVLKRVQNRYHGAVNGYFLCDRGRFGAGFINREDRPRHPWLRQPGQDNPSPAGLDEAESALRDRLTDAQGIIGIGSPRTSLEGNYALRRLVGPKHFSNGMGSEEHAVVQHAVEILQRIPSIRLRETENCDAVLVLGEDLTQTAPRLALSLRQSVRNAAFARADAQNIPHWNDRPVRDVGRDRVSPLFQATTHATRLDDVATRSHHAAPANIARLGFAVAYALDTSAPAVPDLDEATEALAREIAGALTSARRPLVVAGTSLGSSELLDAAANIVTALDGKHPQRGELMLTLPECNSAGMAIMGGEDVDSALRSILEGDTDTLIVLENDLYRRAQRSLVDAALDKAQTVVVLDHSRTATAERAHAVLPAGSYAEADGTLVNNESRAQRFFQVYVPAQPIQEGWRWCQDLIDLLPGATTPGWRSLDGVIDSLTRELPALAGIREAAPGADFRLAGQHIARETHRFSGRTALTANQSVHEGRPVADTDSPMVHSMEGYPGKRPAALIPFFWAPRWSSNQQALNKFQEEIGGSLIGGDPGVRLFEGSNSSGLTKASIPGAFTLEPGWLAVPRHEIFGSELMSALAPAIIERTPRPYVAIHPDDAATFAVEADNQLELQFGDTRQRLLVRLDDSQAKGTLGIPVGLPGLEDLSLPARIKSAAGVSA